MYTYTHTLNTHTPCFRAESTTFHLNTKQDHLRAGNCGMKTDQWGCRQAEESDLPLGPDLHTREHLGEPSGSIQSSKASSH